MYLYMIGSVYTSSHGLYKLGCTSQPVERMYQYNTGDAPGIGLDKEYVGLWEINATCNNDMLSKESVMHHYFREFRLKRVETFTEWFSHITYDTVNAYITSQSFYVRTVSPNEIKNIHHLSQKEKLEDRQKEWNEEWLNKNNDQKFDLDEKFDLSDEKSNEDSFDEKEHFFSTVLPGKKPRRIQFELWDKYVSKIEMREKYRGIVQWPTGTGKTVAILTMIYLTFQKCTERGVPYSGLLIANKNDIFNTLSSSFSILEQFGISVLRCDNGRIDALRVLEKKENDIKNKPILITVTHQTMSDEDSWDLIHSVLENQIVHIHYDEVHRITGSQFMNHLQTNLEKIPFLTGTSATPKTSDPCQHKKMSELFGDPLEILHYVSVEEAIQEEWIAKPRFNLHIISKEYSRLQQLQLFFENIIQLIHKKGIKSEKVIIYLPEIKDVKDMLEIVISNNSDNNFYMYNAIDDVRTRSDIDFIKASEQDKPHLLFACQRYREGSDISQVELTCVLMGQSISAYILLQIIGRALRLDYPGKQGWCLITKPADNDETQETVFESVVFDLLNFVKRQDEDISFSMIKRVVSTYFEEVGVSNENNERVYDVMGIDETIRRVQEMYERRECLQKNRKERYETIRKHNKEYGFLSKKDYVLSNSAIPNPEEYFKEEWKTWYHFLGVDVSVFYPTKYELIEYCKQHSIREFSNYLESKAKNNKLPLEPNECYEDWTNWQTEIVQNEDDYFF